jgi:hypothetical protein
MVNMFYWKGVWMERRLLWPFSLSPRDDDIANAERVGVLGAKVLNDAFKPVEPGVVLAIASVAHEEFLAKLLG